MVCKQVGISAKRKVFEEYFSLAHSLSLMLSPIQLYSHAKPKLH